MSRDHQDLGPRAPIAEAVVDIQVRLKEGTGPDDLRRLHEQIADEYPDLQERRRFAGQMQVQDSGPPKASGGVETDGWMCFSEERNRIVQFRLDGYSYNLLRPYTSWPRLAEDARKYWQVYLDSGRILTVTRVALRYINRFALRGEISFDDYFTAAPRLPTSMPQGLLEFRSRVTVPYLEQGVMAQISQALLPGSGGEFVIDIDVGKECRLDPTDEQVWESLESLRAIKNEIFFGHVTETFLEDIQGDHLRPSDVGNGE